MDKTASPQEIHTELQSLISYCGTNRPSREVVASKLRGLVDRLEKPVVTAAIIDGLCGKTLKTTWSSLRDMQSKLKDAAYAYSEAASVVGGPAEKAANDMVKKIQSCISEIERLSERTLSNLAKADGKFIGLYGDPSDYADRTPRRPAR